MYTDGATQMGAVSSGQYQERWAVGQPGCLIIMVDQSGSMEEQIGAGQLGAGTKKADAAAQVLNNVLNELQKRCTSGVVVRPRVDVAVLGYGPDGTVRSALGGALANQEIVSITDLAANPLRVKNTVTNEYDSETGAMVQIPVQVPIWIEPLHENGTPMCMALQVAYGIAQNWAATHPVNFPPVVLNITDGDSTDGDPLSFARQMSQITTADGAALLFNLHFSSTNAGFHVKYPSDISQVPPDKLAQQLFEMSSVLPKGMVDIGNSVYGMGVAPGARGFVFGADIQDLSQFITIASLPNVDPSMR